MDDRALAQNGMHDAPTVPPPVLPPVMPTDLEATLWWWYSIHPNQSGRDPTMRRRSRLRWGVRYLAVSAMGMLSAIAVSCTRVRNMPAERLEVYDGFESTRLSGIWDTIGFVPGAVTMQSEIVRAGNGAVKIVLHPHDKFEAGINGDADSERAELKEAQRFWSRENTTYEQSFSMLIPTGFPVVTSRLVIAQWKQACPNDKCENDRPLLCIRYASGILRINQVAPRNRHLFETKEELRGKWLDFRFQTRFSSGEGGKIRAWLNGRKVVDYTGSNAYPENATTGYPNPSQFYFRMGLYRDVMAEPMTIYIDEYRKKQLPDEEH
jgi:hypothetical protein